MITRAKNEWSEDASKKYLDKKSLEEMVKAANVIYREISPYSSSFFSNSINVYFNTWFVKGGFVPLEPQDENGEGLKSDLLEMFKDLLKIFTELEKLVGNLQTG